jgi:stage III sporulation protein AA
MDENMNWKQSLLPLLSEDMRQALTPLDLSEVTEIRLRLGRPMELVTPTASRLLYAPNGRPMLREGEQEGLLSAFCGHARYAWEKEIQQGFITLQNGCRVGITGRIASETGAPAMVTGFCIRILRPVVGCGEKLLPSLLSEGRLRATLLYSGPGAGKTTLLRDIVRLLSDGLCGAAPHRVGVVDERFEIGGQTSLAFDLGERTDVLSGVNKGEGLLRLLATMSPQVLAADELNLSADVASVLEAKSRGVTVLCTAQGGTFEELLHREGMRKLFRARTFQRYVRLVGCGAVDEIRDEAGVAL